MRPRISIQGSVHPSVRPRFRQNQGKSTFEQINVRADILGSLDASLHLYKTFYQSIVWSVSILSSREYQ